MLLDELKQKLSDCVRQYSISRFDAEDIIELVTEGERIDWIVDQLKSDAQIDVGAVTSLLTEIRAELGIKDEPAKEEAAEPAAEESSVVEPAASEPAVDSGAQAEEPADISQLDMSRIGQMLPQGMKLPPGMGTKEIMNLLESPQGKIMEDFIVFCREKGIDLDSGKMSGQRIENLQREWQSTPRDAFEGKTPSDMLSHAQEKVETVRRQEPRVGRNDPCPCGSGKKFKKCCGRA
jgi:preprotein translocase subunit SecA